MKTDKTYRGLNLLDCLPDGWKLDATCGSPLHGYAYATDGKSILNGGKRALVKVAPAPIPVEAPPQEPTKVHEQPKRARDYTYAKGQAKTVNQLARERFKERLLQDILTDLMVCELEGWDKLEYIQELKTLITGVEK